MKIAIINTTDQSGGAGRAAYRLHRGVQSLGATSHMIVQEMTSDDFSIIGPQGKVARGMSSIRPTLDLLPLYLNREVGSKISPAWFPNHLTEKVTGLDVDIIHLNWINKGFLPIQSLKKLQEPILWTLHDMWPFTGGCHYALECERYVNRCGLCPQLGGKRENDLTRWIWNRKSYLWRNIDFTIVCPSRWLANSAGDSSLFAERRIEVIANGLDLERFRPTDRRTAREWIGLPHEKKLVLFSAIRGSTNTYKGFQFLEEIFSNLAKFGWENQLEIIVMGSSRPQKEPNLHFPTHYLGQLKDEITLALVYGAVDLFLAPSIQDNLPNTIIESLACGTPSVSFEVGGIPEEIDHQINGYLVKPYDLVEFAFGIDWVLSDQARWKQLSQNARIKAEQSFDIKNQARLYLDLYSELISNSESR